MLIDWFTVGAQAVNFLILAWLLKHFLYGPILRAIDARETKIAAELASAAAREAEAKRQSEDFKRKNEEFDTQRADLLARATSDASKERDRLIQKATADADALAAKRRQGLVAESAGMAQGIASLTETAVLAVARKSLTDLASASLEERVVGVFAQRIHDLDASGKANLANAVRTQAGPAVVRSAFEMPPAGRKAIQDALNVTLALDVQLRFETAPDLICGMDLTTNGQRISWSIGDYLGNLKDSIDGLLSPQLKPNAPAHP